MRVNSVDQDFQTVRVPNQVNVRKASVNIRIWIILFPIFMGASLALVACGDGQERQAGESPPVQKSKLSVGPTPVESTDGSDAILPVLSLEHRGDIIEGRRGESCWTPHGQEERECLVAGNWKDVDSYSDAASGDTLTVRIAPDSVPSRLSVYFVPEPGEVGGEFIRLPAGRSSFVLDEAPGSYKVRITAQWSEGDAEVSYGFGIRIPGAVELKSECASTAMGGILGIVLDSLRDPDRTAFEAVNDSGCRFNKRIAQVRLILEDDGGHRYTETFRFEPPSQTVQFPVPEDIPSEKSGGPLPPGEYSRGIVAVAVDGEEMVFGLGGVGGVVKLTDESPQTDAPIEFPQHGKGKQTYSTSLPEHIEGRLQLYRGCIYIRNGEIPVWPSDFAVRMEDGRAQILDESGNVVGVDGQKIVLAGYEVRADDPAGREISRTLPLACPPGNFWIVGDEIGDMKEKALLPIVPLQGSSLIFPRQIPGIWSDELSLSTEGKLILEGDCLRLDDDKGHMIVWPPLFTPRMGNGVIDVRDGEGGTVARVGDRLEMTGFGSELMRPHYSERCPGPYWIVGRVSKKP